MFYENLNFLCKQKGTSPTALVKELGLSTSKVTAWKNGSVPKSNVMNLLADKLGVSVDRFFVTLEDLEDAGKLDFTPPNITEDYTTFPVIGEVAAGYNSIAMEDWCGDTVDIPDSYLRGHSVSDFFVLKVRGDSMYPIYQDGDKVLILKQSTLNASGDIGVILYDDELATLKKVEYVQGEDWLRLIPLNPTYKPELIEGERVAHCRVIGIPRLLIREID